MTDSRYLLYELRHGTPHLLAEAPDAQGLGLALVTIAEENREAGEPCGIVGVLDNESRRWLTSMWVTKNAGPFQ